MSLSKSFDPQLIEPKWYSFWETHGLFKPADNSTGTAKPPYCIMLPPPNVTGTLHMGHAYQQTLMDILIRYHRMRGFDTLWQVGTDHAGIATQIVVENQLRAEGASRHDLGREAFAARVWQWKEESGSTITRQMRRLGASADWSRERFTMDAGLSHAVMETFVQLYEDGLIYRGKRLVNWDPVLGTAVSDLEVESEEEVGKIWQIRYPLEDESGSVVVATTRPETMLGDVAVAVNPNDDRYKHLIGRTVRLPLAERPIPIIADDYVDPEFGTGVVKITPAHDFNDYQVGLRHGLTPINIFTLDAKINQVAPMQYQGLDRYVARSRVLDDLRAQGLLVSEAAHKMVVPRCGRTEAAVEPMLTDQWFVAMSKPITRPGKFAGKSLAQLCLDVVQEGQIRFVPEHWSSTYNHWLENIQDWCISRQLWWGHRIPAWYDSNGKVFVGRNVEEAAAKAGVPIAALRQDDDVLDTWFSSALWCHSTLGWPERTAELQRYLPTSVLVTGFDIIFFWVVRMVMSTTYFTGKVPFRDVYINSLVRDEDGQKMSKSKGNVLDPLDLIDGVDVEALVAKRTYGLMLEKQKESIAKRTRKQFPGGIKPYGADAVRFTFASLATYGRTLNFDLDRCEGYRNFCNKLWNASRFVLMNTEGEDCGMDDSKPLTLSVVDRWLISRLQHIETMVAEHMSAYRFDLASRAIYEFVWEDYCDWYLELAKVQLGAESRDTSDAAKRGTRRTLVLVLETILRLAHPTIPFITEELWQSLAPLAGKKGVSISIASYPQGDQSRSDPAAEQEFEVLKAIVSALREWRSQHGLKPGEKFDLQVVGEKDRIDPLAPYIRALARVGNYVSSGELDHRSGDSGKERVSLYVEGVYLLPSVTIDILKERERLEKEIARHQAEIPKLETKLNNLGFTESAPAPVVAKERGRLAGLVETLGKLKEQLGRLSGPTP